MADRVAVLRMGVQQNAPGGKGPDRCVFHPSRRGRGDLKRRIAESAGLAVFLAAVRDDLITGRYKPMPIRRVEIPKGNGKVRALQIPSIRDRVVQRALNLILEAVFEADFCPNSYGFRPKRSPHRTLALAFGQVGIA